MTTEAPITTTIKLGQGFDAPWLVLRSNTPKQAADQLGAISGAAADAANSGDILLAIALASKEAQGKYAAADLAAPVNAAPQQSYQAPTPPPASSPWDEPAPEPAYQPAPQQQYQQPAAQQQQQQRSFGSQAAAPSDAPSCHHGPKVYKSGVGKNGKPWQAYMCPAPKNAPDQCEPEWIR